MRRSLTLHPDSRCLSATHIEVDVTRPRSDRLLLQYVVTGAIAGLRLASPGAPARADELWRHTCFEAFLRAPPGEAYYELNFAPSRQWAAYRFSDYRTDMRVADEVSAPDIAVAADAERFALTASLSTPCPPSGSAWRLGLSAVIEEASGEKTYWALAHPPGKPDFHHADNFVCELGP